MFLVRCRSPQKIFFIYSRYLFCNIRMSTFGRFTCLPQKKKKKIKNWRLKVLIAHLLAQIILLGPKKNKKQVWQFKLFFFFLIYTQLYIISTKLSWKHSESNAPNWGGFSCEPNKKNKIPGPLLLKDLWAVIGTVESFIKKRNPKKV